MEERIKSENKLELVIQLVPETGESNYQYVIIDHENAEAISIDCFDPKRVENVISENGAKLIGSFATHHHWDHIGGISVLKEKHGEMEIVGGDKRIKHLSKMVSDGEYSIGRRLTYRALETPCHTTG